MKKSLSEECEFLASEFNIEVTKQSLDERYNTYAVGFMKRCFGKVLNEVLVRERSWAGFGGIFGRIRIGDSSSFQLPSNLALKKPKVRKKTIKTPRDVLDGLA